MNWNVWNLSSVNTFSSFFCCIKWIWQTCSSEQITFFYHFFFFFFIFILFYFVKDNKKVKKFHSPEQRRLIRRNTVCRLSVENFVVEIWEFTIVSVFIIKKYFFFTLNFHTSKTFIAKLSQLLFVSVCMNKLIIIAIKFGTKIWVKLRTHGDWVIEWRWFLWCNSVQKASVY